MRYAQSFRVCSLVVALGLLQACGGASEAELLASAKAYLAQNDNKAAIIQLKTALQKSPDSGEARYLLGKALLDSGDVAGAGVELRKAAELKYPENLVVPALAKALLLQGEHRRVVDSYATVALTDAAAKADLKTTLALAYLRQDKTDLANQSLDEALATAPQYAPAKLLRARIAAGKQDFAASLKLLGEITAAEPANADAWLLQAEIQHNGTRDNAAALASYRKAAELRNDLMPAHQGIVALLVEARDLDGANAHVEQLKKSLPNAPVTKLLDAQMAFLRKDYAATRAITQPLLPQAPNNPLLLQLAGAAEFYLRNLPQAENLLAQAVKIAPGMPLAGHLLAQTYLRTGQPEKALETLRPALEAATPRPEALTLAGEAYLQTGDARRAEEMFTRAAKIRPDDTRARTALALGQIGKGNTAAGLAELEALSAADKGTTADLALIASHLRRKDIDKALKAIDALERKQPDRPLAANLRGRVLMLKPDAAGARASFEQALKLDPVFFPAIASLAALDLAEKKPDAARKRFDDLLVAEPKNYRAMLALAALLARTGGKPQEITEQIGNAVKAAPTEPTPRLQLVNHHLATGNAKAAMAAAQDAATAIPNHRELTHSVGRAQLAAGDFQQAVTSFNKLATLQPKSPLAPLGLADAYIGLKDYDRAERSLKQALELSPKLLVAQRGLTSLYAGDGRYTQALAVAREVQKQRPTEAVGFQLEGDIELQRRNWDNAITAYRTGLQKAPASEAAVKLHNGLVAAGRKDEAERFAATWQQEHASDAAFRFYLGDRALGANDWAQAEARYREVLRVQPENAMALNNVAWLLMKQNKPGALPLAEKATTIAPNQPALLDTLALALAADNQLPRALDLQKKTLERAPDNPSLRLTMARLYLQAGDKAQARTELESLAKLGKSFREQAEVTELLKKV
jgi:putative PEP-CTERM system TPR-repeat lipoprotein